MAHSTDRLVVTRWAAHTTQTQEELEYIRTHAEQFNEMTDDEIASGQEWLQSMLQVLPSPPPPPVVQPCPHCAS